MGSGTLTLSNSNNSYSGGTAIFNGVLLLTADHALGTGAVLPEAGARLSINNTYQVQTVAYGDGDISMGDTGGTLMLTGTPSNSYTLSGRLGLPGKTGGLLIYQASGTGTLTLANTQNYYAGGTQLNRGVLAIDRGSEKGSGVILWCVLIGASTDLRFTFTRPSAWSEALG